MQRPKRVVCSKTITQRQAFKKVIVHGSRRGGGVGVRVRASARDNDVKMVCTHVHVHNQILNCYRIITAIKCKFGCVYIESSMPSQPSYVQVEYF